MPKASINDMFAWRLNQVVGTFKKHLPDRLTHDLSLQREQGGNRDDKKSKQGRAQGSQLKCDEDIKKVTLSHKKTTSVGHSVSEQVQEHAAVVACWLYNWKRTAQSILLLPSIWK